MRSSPPVLRHLANLWTQVEYLSAKREGSFQHKIADLAEASFDGFATLPTKQHARLAPKHGLMVVGYISSGKSSEFRDSIQQNLDCGEHPINVQLATPNTPVAKSVKFAVQLFEIRNKLRRSCLCGSASRHLQRDARETLRYRRRLPQSHRQAFNYHLGFLPYCGREAYQSAALGTPAGGRAVHPARATVSFSPVERSSLPSIRHGRRRQTFSRIDSMIPVP